MIALPVDALICAMQASISMSGSAANARLTAAYSSRKSERSRSQEAMTIWLTCGAARYPGRPGHLWWATVLPIRRLWVRAADGLGIAVASRFWSRPPGIASGVPCGVDQQPVADHVEPGGGQPLRCVPKRTLDPGGSRRSVA